MPLTAYFIWVCYFYLLVCGALGNSKLQLANNGRLLVGFTSNAQPANVQVLLDKFGVKKVKNTKSKNLSVLHADKDSLEQLVTELEQDPAVAFVERDQVVTADYITNDPELPRLWGLPKTGVQSAWDTQRGSRNTVVCVIDTGVDYTHPDLYANMWVNPGEIPGNGIDDDGNGYIDDVYGINAITEDGDPMDDNSHGTHCAGTIGAVGNNAIGVVGVVHTVSIMACKFLSSSGSGYVSDAVLCLDYALEKGARITSNSWGGGGFSLALSELIDTAESRGQLFIAAAGNSAQDNDVTPHYPSSYPQDIVLSVASTDNTADDRLSSFSCWGSTAVDIGVPGSGIYSTLPGNLYGYKSGTSMATPHVSGAAALLLSQNPDLTAAEVKTALLGSVTSSEQLIGKTVSGGRLNVSAALNMIPHREPTQTPAPTTAAPTPGPTSTNTPSPTTAPPTAAPTQAPTTPAPETPSPCLQDGTLGCKPNECCDGSTCERFGKGQSKYTQCVSTIASCAPYLSSCFQDSDCCSGNCRGQRFSKTCQ
uniref:Serine protease n=1 Tax=Tetraselmis sp. GSL018 TaxID=582737 RepID=A0A061S5S3_9CHLO